jgi:hypothetical protein
MTLTDENFLFPAEREEAPRFDFRTALRGVGDPMRRAGHDFFSDFDGTPVPDSGEPFRVGDTVEYVTPDEVRRVGTLLRPHDEQNWLVQVDEGLQHIVPHSELQPSMRTPRHAQRARAQAALQRTSDWKMRRQPEAREDGTTLLTIDVGHGRVAEAEVEAYVRNAGYEPRDASRSGNLLRVIAQDLPQPSPSEPDRGAEPGLHREEIEGTGMPEGKQVWSALEAAGFQLGAMIDDGAVITRSFTVPHKYLTPAGRVTASLSVDCSPISGHFEYSPSDDTLRRFVYTAEGTVEMPYSSGTGPQSTREDYSGGFADGDYVVKAESEAEHQMDAAESRGDMTTEAADKKTKKYYKKYYGPYGEKLTRDIPRRVKKDSELAEAFRSTANRAPTPEEMTAIRAICTAGVVSWLSPRHAQKVEARDLVKTLLNAAGQNLAIKKQLDRIVLKQIGTDPQAFLGRVDPTIYPRILYSEVTGGESQRQLMKLYRQNQDQRPADFGSPEDFQEGGSPAAPGRQVDPSQGPSFGERVRDTARGIGDAVKSRIPGTQQHQDRLVQQVEEDDYQDELARSQVEPSPQRAPAAPARQPAPRSDTVRDSGPPAAAAQGSGTSRAEAEALLAQTDIGESLAPAAKEQAIQQIMKQGPDAFKSKTGVLARAAAAGDKAPAPAGAHNRQKPLGHQVRPKLDRITAQGQYLCIDLVWDPEECRGMSSGNIRHNVVTWMKGLATLKEDHPDLGTIGKPKFKLFDPEAGLARLLVRSSEGRSFPQELFEVEGRDNDTRA